MRYTRREAGRLAAGGLALPYFLSRTMSAERAADVEVGVITYSLRALPDAEAVFAAVKSMGFTEVELMYTDAEQLAGAPKEPPARRRRASADEQAADRRAADALAAWRRSATPATFAPVAERFRDAGIAVRVLCHNFDASLPDERLEYAFQMATGLGVAAISTTTRVSMAKRIAPFADRHRIRVGFHNHDWTDRPDEVATPESFDAVMALSRYHAVNLDIGHFTAAGFDPVAYLTAHHDRITNLHLKDRKKNHGANVPWGQGDTPITAVLQLLKRNGWPIPANVEFEYDGDPMVEVPKCLAYCRQALA